VLTVSLHSQHTAVFEHLPRGNYQVDVKAGSSILASHNVRLSRDSVVRVPVISPADLAVLLLSGLAVAVGLLLVGRKNLRDRLLKPFDKIRLRLEASR
jgi:hypothetical protein